MNKTELYYQTASSKVDRQERLWESLTAKTLRLLGFGSVALATGAVIMRWGASTPDLSSLPAYIFFAMIGLFLCAVASCGWTVRIGNWHVNPNLPCLAKHLPSYEDNDLIEWVADEYTASVEANRLRLKNMASLIQVSMYLILVEFMGLIPLIYFSS